jgi:capsular polysaccharide biosynthesis protein
MTTSNDPSAHQPGFGSHAGAPVLDHTAEFPALTDAHVADSNGAAQGGGWQTELWQRLARRPGRAALAGLVVGVLLGIPVGDAVSQGTVTYSSHTVMLLDDPLQDATSGDAGALVKMDDLRYKYASLAGTDAIAAPVAANLHVPVPVILGATSVQVPANSLLLNVVGTWSTPGFAHELSQAMAQGIVQYIQSENTTYNIPAADQLFANIVSPTSPATATQPSHTRGIAVGLLVFVGAGLVAFTAFQLLTTEPARRRR